MISYIFKVAELFGLTGWLSEAELSDPHDRKNQFPQVVLYLHTSCHTWMPHLPQISIIKNIFNLKKLYIVGWLWTCRPPILNLPSTKIPGSYTWNQDLLFHKASHLEVPLSTPFNYNHVRQCTPASAGIGRWKLKDGGGIQGHP